MQEEIPPPNNHPKPQHPQLVKMPSESQAKTQDSLAIKTVQQQHNSAKLKGSHSALVKLLESAPIAQIKPISSQKLCPNSADNNHYRKELPNKSDLGTSKCPWKKTRLCEEWLMKNHEDQPAAVTVPEEQVVLPKKQPDEDQEMMDLDLMECKCHELKDTNNSVTNNQDCELENAALRRNSSDSTDDEEACINCKSNRHQQQHATDSGCEDSDCPDNKITDLCNRFNENLSKDDVGPVYCCCINWVFAGLMGLALCLCRFSQDSKSKRHTEYEFSLRSFHCMTLLSFSRALCENTHILLL